MKLVRLLEYKLDKTVELYGKKLKERAKKDRTAREMEPEEIIRKLEEVDPTPQKAYIPWLTRIYANNEIWLEDMLTTFATHLRTFDKLKIKRLLGDDADVGKIKTPEQFYEIVGKHHQKLKELKVDQEKSGSYDHVYGGEQIDIVKVLDETAARYFGKDTRWCTTEGAFNSYHKPGEELYIVLPKNPRTWVTNGFSRVEKYQLHIETGQCKDADDLSYKFSKLVNTYPEVATYFRTVPKYLQHPNLLGVLADEETRKHLDVKRKEIKQQQAKELENLLSNILSQ